MLHTLPFSLKNNSMQRHGCEITYSCDNYDDYSYYIRNRKQPVGLHHHEHYELIFFLSGELEYHIENRVYRIQSGDLLLISPAELHQPIFVPAKGFYERFVLWIDEDMIRLLSKDDNDLSNCFNHLGNAKSNLLRPSAEQHSVLFTLFQKLTVVTHEAPAYAKIYEHALLSLILAEINTISNDQCATVAHAVPMSGEFSKYTIAALDFIANHFHEDIGLEQIAGHCYLSPQHLLRLFKADMGISIHKYLNKKRLLTAHQYLLSGTKATVAAKLSGFSNYTTFWRAYKKEYGIPPTQETES